MKYLVTGFNNFCRVFELPKKFSKDYCFGGGIPTEFKMVDWFNPVTGLPQWGISEDKYNELLKSGEISGAENHTKEVDSEELQKVLTEFLCNKNYVNHGSQYIVVCNFGFAFMFGK